MFQNQSEVVVNFIKWISQKYIQLERKTLPYSCKLVGLIYKNDGVMAQVQFSGQAHWVEISIESIIENNYFECFSPKDKKRIFSAKYDKEQFTLSDFYFCSNTGREMVVLTHKYLGGKMTLPVSEVSTNPKLIDQMNPHASNRVGFLSGMERIKKMFFESKEDEE